MDLTIGFDVGTTAIKGVLLDVDKGIAAQATRSTELMRPEEGWVEFSAERAYELVCKVTHELLEHKPPDGNVRAIALSGATGNTGLFDAHMKPIGNVLSWMDARARDHWRARLPAVDPDEVYRRVGWPFGGAFPMGHLAWLRSERPELYSRAAYRLMNITYLYHRLCGRLAIDPSTATTFYLQDQTATQWHEPYLEALGISPGSLPAIRPSGTAVAPLCGAAVEDLGLTDTTMVVLGSFDHPSAARGVGVRDQGELMLSCGTSWVGFYPVNDRELALSQRLLVDPFLRPDGPWGAMFALTSVGVTLDRFMDALVFDGGPRDYGLLNDEAAKAPPGSEGLMLNPLNPTTTRDDALASVRERFPLPCRCRAVMEGVAFEMRRKIELLASAGMPSKSITMVGGPSESNSWTRIVAEVAGLSIRLVNGQSAGASGAAMMAAVGTGLFTELREAQARLSAPVRIVEPQPSVREEYNVVYRGYLDAHPGA
jgi:sugar (pentulose or hexulose) kinase